MNTRFAAALLLSLSVASTSVLAQGRSPDRNDPYRSQEHSQKKDRAPEQNRRGDERSQWQRQDTRHDQRDDRHDRRDDRRDDRYDRYDRRDTRSDRHDDRRYYGASRFHRGEHLPKYYRDHVFVVDHWQSHHLHRPPRGHQWVQVGGDYVLVAITTGIIAAIILNH